MPGEFRMEAVELITVGETQARELGTVAPPHQPLIIGARQAVALYLVRHGSIQVREIRKGQRL